MEVNNRRTNITNSKDVTSTEFKPLLSNKDTKTPLSHTITLFTIWVPLLMYVLMVIDIRELIHR